MAALHRPALNFLTAAAAGTRIRRACGAVALTASLLFPVRPAFGETIDDGTRNAARGLAEQGKELFDGGAYERARDLFQRAYALVPAPTIALFEGRCLSKLGRLVEAEEAFIRAARTTLTANSSEQFRDAVRDAEDEVQALRPRIPKVTLIVNGAVAGAAVSLKLDGKSVSNALIGVEGPIDPGNHVLVAAVPGGEPTQVPFSIGKAEHRRVEISLAPSRSSSTAPAARKSATQKSVGNHDAPPDQPGSNWQTNAAIAAGAVGVAGVATGIIAGALAGARYSKAEQTCPEHQCLDGSGGADALASFRSLRTVSSIGYVIGGVGLAAGVTLFITTPSKRSTSSASVGVWVNGQGAGVTGAF